MAHYDRNWTIKCSAVALLFFVVLLAGAFDSAHSDGKFIGLFYVLTSPAFNQNVSPQLCELNSGISSAKRTGSLSSLVCPTQLFTVEEEI